MQSLIEFRGGPMDGEKVDTDEVFGVDHLAAQFVEGGPVHLYSLEAEYMRTVKGKLLRRRFYQHVGVEEVKSHGE